MIIAISGKSCSGKTVLGRRLSEDLGWEIRHCGEEVKNRASKLGVSPDRLTTEQHREIDNETRDAVGLGKDLIIEGCFLAEVLADQQEVFLVRLDCNDETRGQRYGLRSSSMSFGMRNDSDEELRERLYSSQVPLTPNITFDTATKGIDEISSGIRISIKGIGGSS